MGRNFPKGHIPWNKGIKRPEISGDRNHNWKGNNLNYFGVHSWLYRCCKKHGICEICEKESHTEWALIKGKKYERNILNFMELCKKCHNNYDDIGFKKGIKHFNAKLTDEKVIKIRELFKEGKFTNKEIARKFEIDNSTVGYIVKGKLWKHLLSI